MLVNRWQWGDVTGLVLADTGEAMDKKERKDLDIETMEDKFVAVKTWKKCFDGLSNVNMCTCNIFTLLTSYLVCMYITIVA